MSQNVTVDDTDVKQILTNSSPHAFHTETYTHFSTTGHHFESSDSNVDMRPFTEDWERLTFMPPSTRRDDS
jgi:hypothetical protein